MGGTLRHCNCSPDNNMKGSISAQNPFNLALVLGSNNVDNWAAAKASPADVFLLQSPAPLQTTWEMHTDFLFSLSCCLLGRILTRRGVSAAKCAVASPYIIGNKQLLRCLRVGVHPC